MVVKFCPYRSTCLNLMDWTNVLRLTCKLACACRAVDNFFCKGGQPGGKLSNRLILLLRLFEIVESCSGSLGLHAQALSVLEP